MLHGENNLFWGMPCARELTGELNRKTKSSGKQWSFMADGYMKQDSEVYFS
jgi:hypothetical protein